MNLGGMDGREIAKGEKMCRSVLDFFLWIKCHFVDGDPKQELCTP